MVGVGGQALWGQASGDGLSTLASLHSDSFLIPFQQIVATNVPPEDQDGSGDDSDNFSGSGAGEQQEAVTPRQDGSRLWARTVARQPPWLGPSGDAGEEGWGSSCQEKTCIGEEGRWWVLQTDVGSSCPLDSLGNLWKLV